MHGPAAGAIVITVLDEYPGHFWVEINTLRSSAGPTQTTTLFSDWARRKRAAKTKNQTCFGWGGRPSSELLTKLGHPGDQFAVAARQSAAPEEDVVF